MGTFLLRHFSSTESLRAVQPRYLAALLTRYADYFAGRGVDLGSLEGDDPSYEAVARVLMTPDERMPSALMDDLYYVDEMATTASMDAMLEAAEQEGVPLDIGDEPTPADVAVQVRLRAPELLERKHAEQFLLERRRTFQYFQSEDGADLQYRVPDERQQRDFESALGARLEAMKRGRTCKLLVFPRPDDVWFLVRRGDPLKREGSIEKTRTTSVCYRPEKYDVLRYKPSLGELSINAGGNTKLVSLYRELVGELLFDDANGFPDTMKFTLAPLHEEGPDSLVCTDVEGIDRVTLREVQILRGGPEGEVETRRARDLFAVLGALGKPLPQGRIVKARFLVKFTNTRAPRTVTIRPQNIASYTRDEDATLVEAWLARRGFAQTPIEEAPDADLAPDVAHP